MSIYSISYILCPTFFLEYVKFVLNNINKFLFLRFINTFVFLKYKLELI